MRYSKELEEGMLFRLLWFSEAERRYGKKLPDIYNDSELNDYVEWLANLVKRPYKSIFEDVVYTILWTTGQGLLDSFLWKKLRFEALQKYGLKCMCCGASNKEKKLNVDHIKPRKLFPCLAFDLNNLQILCEDCNHGKANWSFADFRQ